MFERELRDGSFVKRWSIVRTLRDQSVAEHSYYVSLYASDICLYLGLSDAISLASVRYALFHDVKDEIFTGDLPGPNKRAMLSAPGAREQWDARLNAWAARAFSNLTERSGGKMVPDDALTVKLVVKLADWIDAAMEMATEVQLGNTNCAPHMASQMDKALSSCDDLCRHLGFDLGGDVPFSDDEVMSKMFRFRSLIERQIIAASNGESVGPHIARFAL